ncbi:MAG: proprotein convertase P-domain-containing protein [Pyrinomonadaceae bacterium]
MRRFLVFSLTFTVLLTASAFPFWNGAARTQTDDKAERREASTGDVKSKALIPISSKAVNFAESPTLRELATAQAFTKGTRSTFKDREEVIKQKLAHNVDQIKSGVKQQLENAAEKNKRNAEIIRTIDNNAKGTPDAAIARVSGVNSKEIAPKAMPTPTINFETISLTDTTALPGQGFLPPDINGEIGPNHFVETVNVAFRIYSRSGTPLINLTSIGTLFSTIPGQCAGNEDGDPIVMYDQTADRWLISEFCVAVANPNNHQLIAISKTPDPTGAYYLYDFMMPNNKFNDYPKFGIWPDAYYMTDNQFNQAGTQFLGAGVFAFDRAKMISGDPTASFVYFDKADGCPAACKFGGMLPADMDGFIPPPTGAANSIIQFDADEFGGGATDSLRIFDFHVDFATPANSTLTERTGSPLAVAAFDPREVPAGSRNVIPQPGGAPSLDAITDRLMFRLAYRNFGDHESLVLNHTVNVLINPLFRAGVRYYEIQKTTPSGAWSVHEQATMSGALADIEHRWMGSTALNGAGSQALGYSVSSAVVFPSIRYAGRLSTDPAGSLAQGEATLVAGTSSQTHSSGRWGDYSDLTVDPVDDCTFWYTQQYVTGASAPDNTRWHTRVGAFQFGPCPAVPKGILTGTITSAVGGTPINNATVTAGPFIRNSNGSGVYNIDPIGVGTYSLTVSAPGYVTATVPAVAVTLGNTTTQNLQLTPQNILQTGAAAITAESCAAPNNALDPGETVTMDLPIINNGGLGATTTNLVASLQTTGGVASPSGPQTYGAVAQGSPATVRSFTFTVSASCGNVVDITLQLQDGATDYGTIVYSLRTGTLGASSPATYTTGNIATAIPDVSTVDIPIVVSQTGAAADVNVKVRLNHTFDQDLTLTLIAPDDTAVILSQNRDIAAGGGDNYGTGNNGCSGTPTIFDDAAATPIGTGTPPFAGTFKPEESLSAFNGHSIAGTWKLRVNDNASVDTGTVGCVTLDISRQPFICCGVVGTPLIASGGSAALSAESIAPANSAPDPGETVTASFPLINTGDGNTIDLVATLQNSGGVSPITPTADYGVVVAGGPSVNRSFTFVTSGTCGNNVTATVHLQDGAVDLGNATYTFRLGTTSTTTTTFSNATAVAIPGSGTGATTGAPANPYPSNMTVAGLTNPVAKVTVTLKQISHSFPGDADVLLVGPTGVKFIVMSDVIGGTDLTGQTYTFDDSAAGILPSSGTPPASGTFKPTNIGTVDAFPAPAPAGPYLIPATAGTDTLAAFNNLNPNGTWSLYVVDDASSDIGQFAGGWDLSITTTQSICNAQTCSVSCPANITVPADGGGVSAVVNYPAANPTGACGVLNYDIASGATFPLGQTTVNVTGPNAAACSFSVTVTPLAAFSTNLIISEFRLRGLNGPNDEFIELYNTANTPETVVSAAGTGLGIAASDGTLRCSVPNGIVIPAHGHYLCVNSAGYGLATYPAGDGTAATGDATYTTDIPDNAGIALFNNNVGGANFSLANRIDAVGSTAEANTLYKEGTGYPALSPMSLDYAFYRDTCGKGGTITTTGPCPSNGLPVDTNNNATDFIFVETNGTLAAAGQRLGAPGPENLSSPILRNGTIVASLIAPCLAGSVSPNRIRNLTSDPANNSTFGTLSIRRTFTNNTGGSVTRLRFRVIDITTFPAPSGIADLRVRTSSNSTIASSPCGGGSVNLTGLPLELGQVNQQPNGGGFNSSLSAGTITLATPLGSGASINVDFLLGIQQTGTFRFFINLEALP